MTDADRSTRFRQLLRQHARIIVAGVGDSGKSVLTTIVTDREVIHTDDFIKDDNGRDDWDGCPDRCALRCPLGPVVIEGVRALAVAKLLKEPIDCVVWLDQRHPRAPEYSPEQERAAKGRRTSFAKWLRENRGAEVVRL